MTGAHGQLGRCLVEQCQLDESIEVDAYNSSELDISDPVSVNNILRESAPDYVVNAAAYTAVDKAESEPERAFAVNEQGVLNLAVACSDLAIPLIHISTDYVFSGDASAPYKETDPVEPAGVYGASKLAGERAIEQRCQKYIIVRTAWVYSEYGNNFVKTMLRLAESRNELAVVKDQLGSPTYARDIAKALINICKDKGEHWGTYHYVGSTLMSWCGFAEAIFETGCSMGLLEERIQVKPITTSEYPTAAVRPAYSVLATDKIENTFGIKPVSLDASLPEMLGLFSSTGP